MIRLYSNGLILFCSLQLIIANKYSREANENIYQLNKPFRIQRLNILWEKATQKLNTEQLQKLLDDLKHQDKYELELKRIKAENQDIDGKKEAEVRRRFRMILKKYQLEPENLVSLNDNVSTSKHLFKDKKLDNLWKKIQKLDLTEDQIAILKEELKDFENQLLDYHRLVNQYHNQQQKKIDLQNLENHIDDPSLESTNNLENEVNEKIQQKHQELKNEYKRISDMIYTKEIKFKGEFEEEKAARLWQLALKSDFTNEELEDLKRKLLHFQDRIKKLNYFSGQLKSKDLKNNKMNNLSEEDANEINLQKHITNRVKDLDNHVKKLHHQLEQKILQKHVEL